MGRVRALCGLHHQFSLLMLTPILTSILQVTPAYNEEQALAYALARLPGCYAACSRIFIELAARLPGFAPKSLLDFGAGPGTASWAAQEVRVVQCSCALMRHLVTDPLYGLGTCLVTAFPAGRFCSQAPKCLREIGAGARTASWAAQEVGILCTLCTVEQLYSTTGVQNTWRAVDMLPGFAPKSLLDFGAGPGTASWAAQEVHILSGLYVGFSICMTQQRYRTTRVCRGSWRRGCPALPTTACLISAQDQALPAGQHKR
jgi:hypothetical protein